MKLHTKIKKSFLKLFESKNEFEFTKESLPEEPNLPTETLRTLAEMEKIRKYFMKFCFFWVAVTC